MIKFYAVTALCLVSLEAVNGFIPVAFAPDKPMYDLFTHQLDMAKKKKKKKKSASAKPSMTALLENPKIALEDPPAVPETETVNDEAELEADTEAKAAAEAEAKTKAIAEAETQAAAQAAEEAKIEAEKQAMREAEEKALAEKAAAEAAEKARIEAEKAAAEAAEKARIEAERLAAEEAERKILENPLNQPRPDDIEAKLATKYAAIEDLGEKAFTILVDLGLVAETPTDSE